MNELISLYSNSNDGKARNSEEMPESGLLTVQALTLRKCIVIPDIRNQKNKTKREKVKSGHEYHSLTDTAKDYSPIEK